MVYLVAILDHVKGPEEFSHGIGIGTKFSGTFSYSSNPTLSYYFSDTGPTYIDLSFSIEYTIFGNTKNHHIGGKYAFHVDVSKGTSTDSRINFSNVSLGEGSLAGSLPIEGQFGISYSSGAVLNNAFFPIRIKSEDFLGGSTYFLLWDPNYDYMENGGTIDYSTAQPGCLGDYDIDHDVDGSDLKRLIELIAGGLTQPENEIFNFSMFFGKDSCN